MHSTIHSTTSSPTRRALHERTPSQTNEEPPSASLRLVTDKEDSNVPLTNPCPTKPEHTLSPKSGQGQAFARDSFTTVSDAFDISSLTRSSVTVEQSIADLWDLPSIFDAGRSSSQMWEGSSRSSYPDPISPAQGLQHRPREKSATSSDDDIAVLPTDAPTIKAVVSEPSSPDSPTAGPSGLHSAISSDSSPNVIPIGPPSSPSFVALDSSSLNFIPIGTSSSKTGSATRSNSMASLNSMGTVVRHIGATPWIHPATSEHSSSRSRSQSFRSTPPVASVQSGSLASRGHSRSGSGTASANSILTGSDIHAIIDSGVFIQYPMLRDLSASSSQADSSRPPIPGSFAQDSLTDGSSGPRNRHLSTVSSQWSAECSVSPAAPAGEPTESTLAGPSAPPAALTSRKASSSLWLVSDAESDEHLDHLTNLPSTLVRPRNPAVPSSSSSGSRRSSLRSIKRPGTSSSSILNVVPAWARAYYQSDGRVMDPALSIVETSRPSSARRPSTSASNSNSNILTQIPTALSRPRTRPYEITEGIQQRMASDPRDPRSHWVAGPELENGSRPGTSRNELHGAWSPHLFPDRHLVQHRSSAWGAVSMNSSVEPVFGRRNIQIYSFCLGFIFPFGKLSPVLTLYISVSASHKGSSLDDRRIPSPAP